MDGAQGCALGRSAVGGLMSGRWWDEGDRGPSLRDRLMQSAWEGRFRVGLEDGTDDEEGAGFRDALRRGPVNARPKPGAPSLETLRERHAGVRKAIRGIDLHADGAWPKLSQLLWDEVVARQAVEAAEFEIERRQKWGGGAPQKEGKRGT